MSLLLQLHDRSALINVGTGLAHRAREHRANALEVLENSLPRPPYQCLQTLVDDLPLTERIRLLDAALGSFQPTESLQEYLLREGTGSFTDWTLSVALRHGSPDSAHLNLLIPYLQSPIQLLRESAHIALQTLRQEQPTGALNATDIAPYLTDSTMSKSQSVNRLSYIQRVMVLKNTRLFADTPEAILSSIAPIIRETPYSEGQEIVKKGQIGTCIYIIYEGEVDISDEGQLLAHFDKGDFFGELALLDAEARSATVAAATDVLLLRIDQEDLYDLMEERPEVLRNMIRLLCSRIRSQNAQLRAGAVSLEAN
ncbi:MAG: cyclic nucleotide-binding domain-containing protein [Cytophagaceae bacterium]|nr:cyclic nucleotide-binding domain-containing protein [Cytophagaceae bacterium]